MPKSEKKSAEQHVPKKAAVQDASSKGPKKRKRAPVSVTCSATKRNGKPCGLPPIKGGTVCHKHGGSAPQVRQAANRRLIEMVLPAMKELHKIIDRDDVADADKLRAIQMVLNRTGYNERQTIDVGLREPTPFDNLATTGFRIVRGVENVVDNEDRALESSNGDDPEHYAIASRRNANRAELDSATYLPGLDDVDVVVGRVVDPAHPYPPGPIDWEKRDRAASRRPTEFGGRLGDPEEPWESYEGRVREAQE